MRTTRWVLLAVGIMLGLLGDRLFLSASAQSTIPDGSFVQRSDGALWLVVGGKRASVPLFAASDDEVNAIPESGLAVVPGGDGATGLALSPGQGPAPITSALPPPPEVVGRAVPDEGYEHVVQDAALDTKSRPPTSGQHYPTWVQTYGMLDPAPPTGNWVHNLEHGAVVILYNCPEGCPEIVQQLADLYPTLPLGPNARGARPRVLIMPYSDMDAKIAAVAWGWLLEQSELDVDQLRTFVEQRVDRGPECRDLRCP